MTTTTETQIDEFEQWLEQENRNHQTDGDGDAWKDGYFVAIEYALSKYRYFKQRIEDDDSHGGRRITRGKCTTCTYFNTLPLEGVHGVRSCSGCEEFGLYRPAVPGAIAPIGNYGNCAYCGIELEPFSCVEGKHGLQCIPIADCEKRQRDNKPQAPELTDEQVEMLERVGNKLVSFRDYDTRPIIQPDIEYLLSVRYCNKVGIAYRITDSGRAALKAYQDGNQ